jgi:hypothetical protein
VGPRASLDTVEKRKIPSPYRDSNPTFIQPVAQRYTTELSRIVQKYYIPTVYYIWVTIDIFIFLSL